MTDKQQKRKQREYDVSSDSDSDSDAESATIIYMGNEVPASSTSCPLCVDDMAQRSPFNMCECQLKRLQEEVDNASPPSAQEVVEQAQQNPFETIDAEEMSQTQVPSFLSFSQPRDRPHEEEEEEEEEEKAEEREPRAGGGLTLKYNDLAFILQHNPDSHVSQHGSFNVLPLICGIAENQLWMDFGLQTGRVSLTDTMVLWWKNAERRTRRLPVGCFDPNHLELIFVQEEFEGAEEKQFMQAQQNILFHDQPFTVIPRDQVPEKWTRGIHSSPRPSVFLLAQSAGRHVRPLPADCTANEFELLKLELEQHKEYIASERLMSILHGIGLEEVLRLVRVAQKVETDATSSSSSSSAPPAPKRACRRSRRNL